MPAIRDYHRPSGDKKLEASSGTEPGCKDLQSVTSIPVRALIADENTQTIEKIPLGIDGWTLRTIITRGAMRRPVAQTHADEPKQRTRNPSMSISLDERTVKAATALGRSHRVNEFGPGVGKCDSWSVSIDLEAAMFEAPPSASPSAISRRSRTRAQRLRVVYPLPEILLLVLARRCAAWRTSCRNQDVGRAARSSRGVFCPTSVVCRPMTRSTT
jgi:hypothetical protein